MLVGAGIGRDDRVQVGEMVDAGEVPLVLLLGHVQIVHAR